MLFATCCEEPCTVPHCAALCSHEDVTPGCLTSQIQALRLYTHGLTSAPRLSLVRALSQSVGIQVIVHQSFSQPFIGGMGIVCLSVSR
jgi:hypothetical protein